MLLQMITINNIINPLAGRGRAAGGALRVVAVAPAAGVPARHEGVAGGEARPARNQPPHRIVTRASQGGRDYVISYLKRAL